MLVLPAMPEDMHPQQKCLLPFKIDKILLLKFEENLDFHFAFVSLVHTEFIASLYTAALPVLELLLLTTTNP